MSFSAVGLDIEEEAMQEAASTCQAADSLIQQLLLAVMATLRHSEDEVAMAVVPFLLSWVARLKANQKRSNAVSQVEQHFELCCSCRVNMHTHSSLKNRLRHVLFAPLMTCLPLVLNTFFKQNGCRQALSGIHPNMHHHFLWFACICDAQPDLSNAPLVSITKLM